MQKEEDFGGEEQRVFMQGPLGVGTSYLSDHLTRVLGRGHANDMQLGERPNSRR